GVPRRKSEEIHQNEDDMTKIEGSQTVVPTAPVEMEEPGAEQEPMEQTAAETAKANEPDSWEPAKEEHGFFARLGAKIDKRIDDATGMVKEKVDAAKELNQAVRDGVQEKAFELTEPVREALKPDAEIMMRVEETRTHVKEATKAIVERYGNDDVKEAAVKLASGESTFVETTLELFEKREEIAANTEMKARSQFVQGGEGLIKELAIFVADQMEPFEPMLQAVTEKVAGAGKFFEDVEDAAGPMRLAFPVENILLSTVTTQLNVLAGLGQGLLDTNVEVRENRDDLREANLFLDAVSGLEQGQEHVFDAGYKASLTNGAGLGVEAGVKLSVEHDPKNEGQFIVRMEKQAGIAVNIGAEVGEEGWKASLGSSETRSIAFRFDMNNPDDARNMRDLVYAHVGLMSPEKLATALPDHIDAVTTTGKSGLSASASAGMGLTFNTSGVYSETRRPTPDGDMLTRSFGLEKRMGANTTSRLQLPSSAIDQLPANRDPGLKPMVDLYRGIVGDQVGFNASATASARVGFDHPDGSVNAIDPEKVSRVFLEFQGKAVLGTKDVEATLLHEIHNPAELARHLGISAAQLIDDISAQNIDLEDLGARLGAQGRDLGDFLTITVSAKTTREDGAGIRDKRLHAVASRRDPTDNFELRIFPPDTARTPQSDVAEAERRILDRHWPG
ncbi:MAG: hypothetical protein ACNA8W_13965, partial [Bradymonadaceae bacterium]